MFYKKCQILYFFVEKRLPIIFFYAILTKSHIKRDIKNYYDLINLLFIFKIFKKNRKKFEKTVDKSL